MGNSHTGAQCLNRWDKTIKPTFRKGKWTEEEDNLLKRGVDMYGIGNWKKIASIVTSRTDVQCRERWVNILDPTIDHGLFEFNNLIRTLCCWTLWHLITCRLYYHLYTCLSSLETREPVVDS